MKVGTQVAECVLSPKMSVQKLNQKKKKKEKEKTEKEKMTNQQSNVCLMIKYVISIIFSILCKFMSFFSLVVLDLQIYKDSTISIYSLYSASPKVNILCNHGTMTKTEINIDT